MADDDEATVRLPRMVQPHAPAPVRDPAPTQAPTQAPVPTPAPPRRRLGLWLGVAGGAAAMGAAGLSAMWFWSGPPAEAWPERPLGQPLAQPRARVTLAAPPPLLNHAAILAHQAREPTALRWSANPLVWVLDFPSLELQGLAMNRAAALLEKASTPRDRVLDDAALAAAIAADGKLPATWYFGHNYRASDLGRMARLAREAGIALNPLEHWVLEQVAASRRLEPSRDAAFITLPALGPGVNADARGSVLLHELGHGQFMTLPFFAAHVMRVWSEGFTAAERASMRQFLAADGYDTRQEELMANEAMAYLLYTPDRRFFDPARDLGWSDAQTGRLRAMLRAGAPSEP